MAGKYNLLWELSSLMNALYSNTVAVLSCALSIRYLEKYHENVLQR
jgi:hypothetical protein